MRFHKEHVKIESKSKERGESFGMGTVDRLLQNQ